MSNDGKVINLAPNYASENTTQLLAGVLYNAPLDAKVKQLIGAASNASVAKLLDDNTALANNQLVIETTKNIGGTWTLSVSVNGTLTYVDSNFDVSTIDKLFLQSHWGSGVVFNNMKVDKK